MKLIELSNYTNNGSYFEITVTYRQLIPDSIKNNSALLYKAHEIAQNNSAYIQIIDGIEYIVSDKRYSCTIEDGIIHLEPNGDEFTGTLDEFFAKLIVWHNDGKQQVEMLAYYLLNNPNAPELLIGKYYDGTDWKDSE